MKPIRALTGYVSRFDRGTFAAKIVVPYLVMVIGVTIYFEISTHQSYSEGMEGYWLFAITSPLSQLLMFLPLDSLPEALFSPLLLTVAGLIQAWLLWLIARGRVRQDVPAEMVPAPAAA